MSDDIARLSEALARDPASLAFIELAEALRKRGDAEVATKVAKTVWLAASRSGRWKRCPWVGPHPAAPVHG